jgi:hypothetical protein
MTRKSLVIGAGIAAALTAVAWGYGSAATAQPYGGGWGMMGGGYGPGGGPGFNCPWADGGGPGWMHGGRGYGPGWMRSGPGRFGSSDDLKLTTDNVKTQLDRWLTRRGNPRLKVGDVKEKDADTIVADIVTKDNSLVQRFNVNRHTGDYDRDGE